METMEIWYEAAQLLLVGIIVYNVVLFGILIRKENKKKKA